MEIISIITEEKWPKTPSITVRLSMAELNQLFNTILDEKTLQAYNDGYEDGTSYGRKHPE